jgi:hypothetical protein
LIGWPLLHTYPSVNEDWLHQEAKERAKYGTRHPKYRRAAERRRVKQQEL